MLSLNRSCHAYKFISAVRKGCSVCRHVSKINEVVHLLIKAEDHPDDFLQCSGGLCSLTLRHGYKCCAQASEEAFDYNEKGSAS